MPPSAFNGQRRTAEVQAQAQEEEVVAVVAAETAGRGPMMTTRSSRPRDVAGCLAMTHLDERAEGKVGNETLSNTVVEIGDR